MKKLAYLLGYIGIIGHLSIDLLGLLLILGFSLD